MDTYILWTPIYCVDTYILCGHLYIVWTPIYCVDTYILCRPIYCVDLSYAYSEIVTMDLYCQEGRVVVEGMLEIYAVSLHYNI